MDSKKLKVVVHSSNCMGGSCPTIYETESGDFVVQGYTLDEATQNEIILPVGEQAVMIPADIAKALRNYLNQQ